MIDEHGTNQDKVNIADRTAIIVAGVAIGVSLFAAPGLYGPTNILIGLALIVTLHAADSHQDRNRFQSASFALAWALAFLLIAGLFVVNPYIPHFTDTGEPIIDHFTFIEFPHFQWIEHTFQDQASDLVSFCLVGIVATIWYVIRRRFFAVYHPPLQPKGRESAPSKPSPQPVPTPVPTEKRQEHAMEAVSVRTYHVPQTAPLAAKHRSRTLARGAVTLSVFTAVMALFVYVVSSRWLKQT